MSSSSNVYLFVISSRNHKVYKEIQEKRRRLLSHYNIPYSVLINHDESSLDDKTVPTLVPLNDEEILYNGGGYNPYMAQKFLMAVKMLFRSYDNYEDIPNYIIRINATVYVHFPSLLKILNDENFPKERVLAGPNWGDMFVQGMVMVFSKDVLMNMLNDPRMYSKKIMKDNDDVSLSVLADPHSKWIDWSEHLCQFRACSTNDKGVYLPEKIQPIRNEKWMFRINEPENDRRNDPVNWDVLLRYFDEYHITTPPPFLKRKPKHVFTPKWIVVVLIILVLCSVLIWRNRTKLVSKCRKILLLMKNKTKK